MQLTLKKLRCTLFFNDIIAQDTSGLDLKTPHEFVSVFGAFDVNKIQFSNEAAAFRGKRVKTNVWSGGRYELSITA